MIQEYILLHLVQNDSSQYLQYEISNRHHVDEQTSSYIKQCAHHQYAMRLLDLAQNVL